MEKGKEVVKAMHKMEERRIMRKLRESLQQNSFESGINGMSHRIEKNNTKI